MEGQNQLAARDRIDDDNELIDLLQYWKIINKYKWRILGFAFCVTFLVAFVVQTLRHRQSSFCVGRGSPTNPVKPSGCGQTELKRAHSRTPVQGATSWGGRHRSASTGGAAYGIPRNAWSPVEASSTSPEMSPE